MNIYKYLHKTTLILRVSFRSSSSIVSSLPDDNVALRFVCLQEVRQHHQAPVRRAVQPVHPERGRAR